MTDAQKLNAALMSFDTRALYFRNLFGPTTEKVSSVSPITEAF